MKLASIKNQTRDGQLVVVSKDLSRYIPVPTIALTMQQALDNWVEVEGPLKAVYQSLTQGEEAGALPFVAEQCESPLPRAYQWADGSAYVNHVELVRKARGAEIPGELLD